MPLVDFAVDEHVAVVTMRNDENRFNPDFLQALLNIFDDIEHHTDARVLMMRSAHEKIFSNGLDLNWLIPTIQSGDVKQAREFFFLLNQVFKRTLLYPMITIAVINGHAFAGGAIWTCAFDFRFMRSDRGFFCLPEVDLGIPFLPGMNALLKKAIPMYKLEELQFTGIRLTADECVKHHIVINASPIETLMDDTLKFAKQFKKKREIIKEMKHRLYKDIIRTIDEEDVPYIESNTFYIG